MRVISKGTQRVQCPRCGSLLEYEWNDIYPFDEDSAEPSYAVLCPECSNMIDVPSTIDPHLKTYQYTYQDLSIGQPYSSLVIGGDVFNRDGSYASATLCTNDASTASTTTALNNLFDAVKTDSIVEAKG